MKKFVLLSALVVGAAGCAQPPRQVLSTAGADTPPVPASSRAGPGARMPDRNLDPFLPHPNGTTRRIITPVYGTGG